MEIKFKLKEVLEINNTLKLVIDDTKTKIDVLLKFRLLGIMKSLESHVGNFEIIKNEKIVEYGKKNKDGTFQINKEDIKSVEKFKQDIEQILNSDVTVNIEPLNIGEVINKGLRSDYLIKLYALMKE